MATKKKATTKATSKNAAGSQAGSRAPKSDPSGARAKSSAGKKDQGATAGDTDETHHQRFFGNLKADFAKVRDAIATEFDRAVDMAHEHAGEKSLLDRERLERVEKELRQQMRVLRERAVETGREVREATTRLRDDERVRGAADAGLSALHGLTSSLRGIAERMESSLNEVRPYPAGEQAAGGSYVCRSCAETTVLARATVLPACGGCGGRIFRRLR